MTKKYSKYMDLGPGAQKTFCLSCYNEVEQIKLDKNLIIDLKNF